MSLNHGSGRKMPEIWESLGQLVSGPGASSASLWFYEKVGPDMEDFLLVKNRNVLSLISAGKPDPPTACGWRELGRLRHPNLGFPIQVLYLL